MSKNNNAKSGGARKINRNLKKCAAYRASGRREARKARNIAKAGG
jgi:hypothetical protein